jgi:hypothetical protein
MSKDSVNKMSLGTGFFVEKDLIVTNFHVVKNSSQISIKFINKNQTYKVLGSLGVDRQNDLALLKVKEIGAKPLEFDTNSSQDVGDTVYVIGNPEGLEGTFSQGIISSIRGNRYIQITAPISKGSSGSPVLNNKGLVIGIAVGAISDGQNLNFAIPVSYLKDLISNKTDLVPLENAFVDNSSDEKGDLIQTLTWIKEKFEQNALPWQHTKTMTSEGCTVKFRHDWTDKTKRMSSMEMNLRDLDPKRVSIQESLFGDISWGVELKTFKDKPVMNSDRYYPDDPFAETRSKVSFRFVISFRDNELATRFSKAIRHAIELCGGQSEPF